MVELQVLKIYLTILCKCVSIYLEFWSFVFYKKDYVIFIWQIKGKSVKNLISKSMKTFTFIIESRVVLFIQLLSLV